MISPSHPRPAAAPPGRSGVAQACGWNDAQRLREYVGLRAIWPTAAGALLGVLTVAVPVSAVTVGALLGASDDGPGIIVLGAFIGLSGPVVGASLWRRRVWRFPLSRRLAGFEEMYGGQRLVTV